jgi:hypothetical protein
MTKSRSILVMRSVQLVIYVWFKVEIKAAAMKWFKFGGPGEGGRGRGRGGQGTSSHLLPQT